MHNTLAPYDLSYTSERFSAEIAADEYIARFRQEERFLELCRQCGNFGVRYGCPPFDVPPLTVLAPYRRVRIVGEKLVPATAGLPLDAAQALMTPVLAGLNGDLLAEERRLGGLALGFAGACPYCGGTPCRRKSGEPCLHPDKVRPSLEAFGFDVGRTAQELLGLEILWGVQEKLPAYLTLVCGLFY